MKIPLIPQDKANHVIDGAVIYVVVRYLAAVVTPLHAREFALAVAVLAGALKEAADWLLSRRAVTNGLRAPHSVEWGDFIATCAGGVLCYMAGE